MRRGYKYILYAVCGVLMALPYTVPALWILAWFSFVPVLICEFNAKTDGSHPYRQAYKRGFAFFYPYGIMTFYWFCELYPLEFTGMSKPYALCVVLLGVFGLSLLQAVVWAFMFVVFKFASYKFGVFEKKILRSVFPALIWVIFEWTQAQTWAGVPWAKIALGQTNVPALIQISSLLGPYFVSFAVICFASLMASSVCVLRDYRKEYGRFKFTNESAVSFALAILIFAADFTYGSARIFILENKDYENKVSVSAVQGNISSVDKWSVDSLYKTLDIYKEYTLQAADDGADIVVWPETALPYSLESNEYLKNYLSSVASEAEVTLLAGAFHLRDDGELENSIFQINRNGEISENLYSKRHLVPFGEYVPFRKIIMTLVPPLNEIGMLDSDIAAGTSTSVHNTEYWKIGSLICFDSIYEPLARESVRDGAGLLAVSTNDSWFNDSSAVYQHNRHSALRAVENGRYVIRSANTGISSVISPTGKIISQIAPLEEGQLTCDVYMIDGLTLYTRVGNIIVPFSLCAVAVILALQIRRKKLYADCN